MRAQMLVDVPAASSVARRSNTGPYEYIGQYESGKTGYRLTEQRVSR